MKQKQRNKGREVQSLPIFPQSFTSEVIKQKHKGQQNQETQSPKSSSVSQAQFWELYLAAVCLGYCVYIINNT